MSVSKNVWPSGQIVVLNQLMLFETELDHDKFILEMNVHTAALSL